MGNLYTFGSDRVLLVLPREAERSTYDDPVVLADCKRFHATLCSERNWKN